MGQLIDRTGEENINKQGLKMKIKEYRNNRDIDIEFENGYIVRNKKYFEFKKGTIKNLYYPSVCGFGFLGLEKLKNEKERKCYKYWNSMLNRCYNKEYIAYKTTYKNCTVTDKWSDFREFYKWFENNYYEINEETMCLDKDILCHNLKLENKVYSPETCIFVPQRINTLFVNRKNERGEYPIGVYKKENNKFTASINSIKIGTFNTVEEAFKCYKEAKENEIKRIANLYKNKIPQRLYEAMYNYVVEITD